MAISNLTTPGVYVQEISTLPPSVAGVATAIPAFIGYTEIKPSPNVPVRISSLIEFETTFGGPYKETFSISVVDNTTSVPNSRAISASIPTPSPFLLYYSMQEYFANGGGPCYVICADTYAGNTSVDYTNDIKPALAKLENEDEPTLILCPDMVNASSSYGTYAQDTLTQCNKLQDRFGIFDYPANSLDFAPSGAVATFRTSLGSNNLKYGAVYMPFLNSVFNIAVDESAVGSVSLVVNGGAPTLTTLTALKTSNPALYNQILSKINSTFFATLPPSGSMAGIYAAVDRDRGVWKAPANVSVNSISGPTLAVTEAQQGLLNVDATSGKSINVIKTFTGRGTIVWGARTLDGNSNEWRYVPVRRLFIFVEESLRKATEPMVFEANDKNNWMRVKSTINSFLTDLWNQGALAGEKPEQAFFVKVGLNETMTAQDILEGKMIIQVGLAAVRPAEFIILQFMHKLQEA